MHDQKEPTECLSVRQRYSRKKDNTPPSSKLLRLRHLLNADAGDIAIFGFDFKFRFMLRLDVPHHLPPQSFGQGFQPLAHDFHGHVAGSW